MRDEKDLTPAERAWVGQRATAHVAMRHPDEYQRAVRLFTRAVLLVEKEDTP